MLGNHINTSSGLYTVSDAGIGHAVDSFYEYLLKAAILFDDDQLWDWYSVLADAAEVHLGRRKGYYMEVHMGKPGAVTWPALGALQAFWPAVLVLAGDVERAAVVARANHAAWLEYGGGLPERFNLATGQLYAGHEGYWLRPEHAESLQALALADRHTPRVVEWQTMCRDMLHTIETDLRVPCGYASRSHPTTLADRMDSFFLAETVKYLQLCLDLDNDFHTDWIYNTEAHPLTVHWRRYVHPNFVPIFENPRPRPAHTCPVPDAALDALGPFANSTVRRECTAFLRNDEVTAKGRLARCERAAVTCADASACAASCPPGVHLVTGGCATNPPTPLVTNTQHQLNTQWDCATDEAIEELSAFAVCCRR